MHESPRCISSSAAVVHRCSLKIVSNRRRTASPGRRIDRRETDASVAEAERDEKEQKEEQEEQEQEKETDVSVAEANRDEEKQKEEQEEQEQEDEHGAVYCRCYKGD